MSRTGRNSFLLLGKTLLVSSISELLKSEKKIPSINVNVWLKNRTKKHLRNDKHGNGNGKRKRGKKKKHVTVKTKY